MNVFTIVDVERAINYWRQRKPSGEDVALCAEARALADVYGQMIYARVDVVDASALNDEQMQALTIALGQADAPL
jgi:hypothetical protein